MSLVVASSSSHCAKLIEERIENFMSLAVLTSLDGRSPLSPKEKMAASMCLRRFRKAFSENISSVGTPLGLHTAMALAEKIMQVLLNSPHSGGTGSSLSAFRDLLSATKASNTVFVHAWEDSETPVDDLLKVYNDVTSQRETFKVTFLGPLDEKVTSRPFVDGTSHLTVEQLNGHAQIARLHRETIEAFAVMFPGVIVTDLGSVASVSASASEKEAALQKIAETEKLLGVNPFVSKAISERSKVKYEVAYGDQKLVLFGPPCGYLTIVTNKHHNVFSKMIADAFPDGNSCCLFTECFKGNLSRLTIVSSAANLTVLGGIATKYFGNRNQEVFPPPVFHRIAFFDMIESAFPVEPDFSKIAIRRTPELQTSVPHEFLPNALAASSLLKVCEGETFHGCEVFAPSETLQKRLCANPSSLKAVLKYWLAQALAKRKDIARRFIYVFMSMKWDFLTIVRAHPLVNYRMTISDSPKEMQSNFGMSGAEMTLINNFYRSIKEMGNDILIGYVTFVVRAMTMGNTIIPMTNNGITSIASNVLEEMNIRKAYDVAMKAAFRGEVVPNRGVTAAAFASSRTTVGTGAITFAEPKSFRLLTRLPFRHFDGSDFNRDPFESTGLFSRRVVQSAARSHGNIQIFAFL